MKKILVILGTRPEAIKMAPVIRALKQHPQQFDLSVCVTGQHRDMTASILDFFQIRPDYDLQVMRSGQTLAQLTARILTGVEELILQTQPDWILVQGDTTTVMASAVAGFYHDIQVGHIEAGLRTHSKRAPFPEEINRRIASVAADLHFAPTEAARAALLSEGVPEHAVHLTGNTVVDALLWARQQIRQDRPPLPEGLPEALQGKRLLLATGHRRENMGQGLEQICLALRELAEKNPDLAVVYPVHPNPNVQQTVRPLLGDVPRVHLVEPQDYAPFIWLMEQSYLILTDSGGVQEEAPYLNKPLLVTRETSERPEGVAAGSAQLVGADRQKIVTQAQQLLDDPQQYAQRAGGGRLYGDGSAAEQIAAILQNQ